MGDTHADNHHECTRNKDGYCNFTVPPFSLFRTQNFTEQLAKSAFDVAENPCEYFSCNKMYMSFLSKLKENKDLRRILFEDILSDQPERDKLNCFVIFVTILLIVIAGLQIVLVVEGRART